MSSWLPHGEGGDRGIARCVDASLRSDGRIEPAHRHLPAREEHLASLGIDCMELAPVQFVPCAVKARMVPEGVRITAGAVTMKLATCGVIALPPMPPRLSRLAR